MSDQSHYSIITIDPCEIDISPNALFRFRRHLPGEQNQSEADRRLVESVCEHGILRPPLLTKEVDAHRESIILVQGFRRCAAARATGLKNTDAVLLTFREDQSNAAVVRWLADIDSGEPLSELEKIICTKKASKLDAEAMLFAASKVYGRMLSTKHLANVWHILAQDDPVLEALHNGEVSTGDLLLLMEHPLVDTTDAVRILAGERLSRSDQKKAVHLMLRIGDGGNKEWKKFAESYTVGSGVLLDTLKKTVHPTLTNDLEQIEKIARDMHLPPGVSITPPENMEGGNYHLQMPIRDEREMEQTLEKLKEALDGKMIAELLKILRGE